MRKGGHIGETKGKKIAEHVTRCQSDREHPQRPEGRSIPSCCGRNADDRSGTQKIEVRARRRRFQSTRRRLRKTSRRSDRREKEPFPFRSFSISLNVRPSINGSGTFVRPAFASVRIGNVRMPNRMCGVVARRSGAAESAATEYLLRIRMGSRTAKRPGTPNVTLLRAPSSNLNRSSRRRIGAPPTKNGREPKPRPFSSLFPSGVTPACRRRTAPCRRDRARPPCP